MKSEVQTFRNHAEEVFERAEEDFANARLLRHGADQDLMQAKMTIEDLSAKPNVSEDRWALLWSSFRSMAGVLRAPEDAGISWVQFLPHITDHLKGFLMGGYVIESTMSCAGPSSCANFLARKVDQRCRESIVYR